MSEHADDEFDDLPDGIPPGRPWPRIRLGPVIRLEPARWEQGTDMRDAYAALEHDLAELGFDVDVPDTIEHRSGRASGSIGRPVADLLIYLGQAVETHLLEAIVAAVLGRLSAHAKWPRSRHAIIYGPDGEPLRRVKLSDPE